jgi:hypothetical protein
MKAVAVKIRNQTHRRAFFLGSGETKPPQTLFVIALDALAKHIHESEIVLRVAMAAFRRSPVPLNSQT